MNLKKIFKIDFIKIAGKYAKKSEKLLKRKDRK